MRIQVSIPHRYDTNADRELFVVACLNKFQFLIGTIQTGQRTFTAAMHICRVSIPHRYDTNEEAVQVMKEAVEGFNSS